MQILYVDDGQATDSLVRSLEVFEHETSVARTVQEAKNLLKDRSFNVILSDGLGGNWRQVYDVAHERNLPVVVLSSNSDIEREITDLGLEGISFLGRGASLFDIGNTLEEAGRRKREHE